MANKMGVSLDHQKGGKQYEQSEWREFDARSDL